MMRIGMDELGRVWHFNLVKRSDRFLPGFVRRQTTMKDERLGNLETDGEARIERGERVLKDDADAVTAERPSLLGGQGPELASREEDAAIADRRLPIEQAHDRKRDSAFARTRFPDEAYAFAAPDREIDVAYRLKWTFARGVAHRQ